MQKTLPSWFLVAPSPGDPGLFGAFVQEPPSQSGRGAQRHQPHHQGSQGALARALAPWDATDAIRINGEVASCVGKRNGEPHKNLNFCIWFIMILFVWLSCLGQIILQSLWTHPFWQTLLGLRYLNILDYILAVSSRQYWYYLVNADQLDSQCPKPAAASECFTKDRKKTKNIKHSGNLTKNVPWLRIS